MEEIRKIKLSPRLLACAEYVPQGTSLVDVGTDHAYLPVWLIQNRRVRTPVTACDIHQGPLERARQSTREYGVEEQVVFMLNDGLAGTKESLAETVVIAGMGGETISGILEASGWRWSAAHTLILQPMSKIPELCRWLYENGFYIERERLVQDAGELYRVLCVRLGERPVPSQLELYSGALDPKDPLSLVYIEGLVKKFCRARDGMAASAKADPKVLEELTRLAAAAEEKRKELMQG